MKKLGVVLGALVMLFGLVGCAQTGVNRSEDATKDNPIVLTLAHNLSDTHITSLALIDFADQVKQASDGRIVVKIYPNGQLGSETEVLEQLMAGVVDMTRVGSPGLATYDEGYHSFGLPYIFDDQDHYYAAMDSAGMRAFFGSSADEGFVGLTYYTSGQRSFYTLNKPIREPADLKGLKIRVQNMRSQTDMVKALGGTPVVMPFGEVYTALQTGIIDGAESNETALTLSNHGEVCKVYSYDEHSMIPDMLVIATKTWQRLTDDDQKLLIDAAIASTEAQKIAWAQATDKAIADAVAMGVQFVSDVNKPAFQAATSAMVSDYADEYRRVGDVLAIIDAAKR